MKRLLLMVLLGAATPVWAEGPTTNMANAVVAIVGDTVITKSDVEKQLEPIIRILWTENFDLETRNRKLIEARMEVVERLVDRQLVIQDFKAQGYNLPDSYIEDEIKRRIKNEFGDHQAFLNTLSANGDTVEAYRKRTREQIIVELLTRKNIGSNLIISPQKIEIFYWAHTNDFKLGDQVKLRMIVLNATANRPMDETRKLAAEIKAKLKEGATFAEMATIYSDGTQRTEGGDWGWVHREKLNENLTAVAFSLKPGQVSEAIEFGGSLYLMLVEEAKSAHIQPLNDVREDIEKELMLQESERLRKKWIDRLRSKAFVRYF